MKGGTFFQALLILTMSMSERIAMMMPKTYKDTEFGKYGNDINIPLFNSILSMAISTTRKEYAGEAYRKAIHRTIWGERFYDYEKYFEPYTLKYLGEVLERFESKFGSDIKHFRAVALAFAYSSPFVDASMFIGQQKEVFLSKLKKVSQDDIYLQGALCLYDQDKEKLHALTERKFTKTEEVLFVLSLYDDKATGFEVLWPELVRLLGMDRTLPVLDNASVYAWFVENYREQIKRCRKKDNAILRALIKLPTMYVKTDSPVYKVLKDHGYSEKEIIYANSHLILKNGLSEQLSYTSIPAEKVATEFCVTYLNDSEKHEQSVYDYIHHLFTLYKQFNVKYQGYQGIWEAVKERLHPVEVHTALWLFQNVQGYEGYDYDVFDPEWDILAKNLGSEKYWDLFTRQLIRQKDSLTLISIDKWLKKYKELTGLNYFDQFKKSHLLGDESFCLLVDIGKLDLWEYFQKYIEQSDIEKNRYSYFEQYLLNYIKTIRTKTAYLFWEKFLGKYTFVDSRHFFGSSFHFHEQFWRQESSYGYSRNGSKLDFQRDFLTNEEEEILYNWISESIYLGRPDQAFSFAVCVLENDYAYELFGQNQMRLLYDQMIECGAIPEYKLNMLKKRYLSEEEFQADIIAQNKKEEEDKKRQEYEEQIKREEKLQEKYDGTLQSLYDYIKHFWIRSEKRKAAILALNKMNATLESNKGRLTRSEVFYLYKLCGQFISYGLMTIDMSIDQIKKISEIVEEE